MLVYDLCVKVRENWNDADERGRLLAQLREEVGALNDQELVAFVDSVLAAEQCKP